MPAPLAYLNGRLVPQSEAYLPLHDAGFVFGATVTDLCRTFHHRLFRLGDHLDRFRRSCRSARIAQPVSDEDLTRIAEALVGQNAGLLEPGQELALVLVATPGPIGYYAGLPGGPGDGPPTLALHTFPLPFARYGRLFREGAHLVVPSVRQVPADTVDPRIKQRSRLHWWLAEQEVHRSDPAAAALLLDAHGHVTETAAANFLIVRNGRVLSPPQHRILAGVSLRTVRELCAAQAIPFEERELTLHDCLCADEALLTCTSYCLAGVRRIDGIELSWPGPVTTTLSESWSRVVGLDYRAQILAAR